MTSQPTRTATARPQFLELNGRRLFALLIEPVAGYRSSVLYLPPFAEEMNRCRSHAVAQARACAARGIRTMLLDPFGTGESEGQLADARWEQWVDDGIAAGQWLASSGGHPIVVWGVRTGALLAADIAASGRLPVSHLLFWQPVVDGKTFVNQCLRLRIASGLVNSAEPETTETIRARLAAGEVIEVAGYPLSGPMAEAISSRRLGARTLASVPRISWLEVVGDAGRPLSPASQRAIEALQEAGVVVRSSATACPMIWQVHKRTDAPELLQETLALLQDAT